MDDQTYYRQGIEAGKDAAEQGYGCVLIGKQRKMLKNKHATSRLREYARGFVEAYDKVLGEEIMGAHYNGPGVLLADSKEEAIAEAKKVIDDSLYMDGHSPYSGGYGTCAGVQLVDKRMTFDDADDHIREHHRKWDPMMLIQDVDDDKKFYYGGWCAC